MRVNIRIGIYLIQESASIILIEHSREPPRLFLERLHVLDLDNKDVPGFRPFDVKGTGQIVDLGEVDILHIVRAIVVADLPPRPVDTFDLDDLAALDLAGKGHWKAALVGHAEAAIVVGLLAVGMPSVLDKSMD